MSKTLVINQPLATESPTCYDPGDKMILPKEEIQTIGNIHDKTYCIYHENCLSNCGYRKIWPKKPESAPSSSKMLSPVLAGLIIIVLSVLSVLAGYTRHLMDENALLKG